VLALQRYGDVLALRTDRSVEEAGSWCCWSQRRRKTTALRCMAGVLMPSAGTVTVDGIDSAEDPAAVRAKVGLMPEVPGSMSGCRRARTWIIRGHLRPRARVRKRANHELLDLFDAGRGEVSMAGAHSPNGMRQKVALIRAKLHARAGPGGRADVRA